MKFARLFMCIVTVVWASAASAETCMRFDVGHFFDITFALIRVESRTPDPSPYGNSPNAVDADSVSGVIAYRVLAAAGNAEFDSPALHVGGHMVLLNPHPGDIVLTVVGGNALASCAGVFVSDGYLSEAYELIEKLDSAELEKHRSRIAEIIRSMNFPIIGV